MVSCFTGAITVSNTTGTKSGVGMPQPGRDPQYLLKTLARLLFSYQSINFRKNSDFDSPN